MKYLITITGQDAITTMTLEFKSSTKPELQWHEWIEKSKVRTWLNERVSYDYRILDIDIDDVLDELVAS
jgi:hypothetical protein